MFYSKFSLLTNLLLGMGLIIGGVTAQASYSPKPIHAVKTNQKIVALTFDDGPSKPYTEQILKNLREKSRQSDFFCGRYEYQTIPRSHSKNYERGASNRQPLYVS